MNSGQSTSLRPGIEFDAVPNVVARAPHPYWTLARIAHALGTGPRSAHVLAGVSTDTRKIQQGDCFVALVGDSFDGHDFLDVARDNGAAALVVSRAEAATGLALPTYVVPDTLVALGQLATAWRMAWGGPVIAVAGSNGKTSTKDMLRAALGSTLAVHATSGNFNNLVGVPLTLLAIPSPAEIAVVEVGTNMPGEIARLQEIVKPDIAVLTSIGEEHLEGLGDLAGVLREECEVFRDVHLAVLPSAHPDAVALARSLAKQTVTTGLEGGDFTPSAWGLDTDGTGWLTVSGTTIRISLRGEHQVANAMIVVAVARACGVPLERVADALRGMPVPNMRGAWQPLGDAVVLNDAYNANPPSMRAALALLDSVGAGKQRVAVLGTMRELGAHAEAQHIAIARAALAGKADVIAAVGDFAAAFREIAPNDPRVVLAAEFDSLWRQLAPRLDRNAVILIKGSRGAKMERLVPFLSAWASA